MRSDQPQVCAGKVHYPTKQAAQYPRARAARQGARVHVYRCPYCDTGWCVGAKARNRNPGDRSHGGRKQKGK